MHFDPYARLQSQNYTLSFDFAVPKAVKLVDSGATVRWNEQVFPIRPTDYQVQTFKVALSPFENKINSLSLKGVEQGLSISNVKLASLGNTADMLVNGDFSTPILK